MPKVAIENGTFIHENAGSFFKKNRPYNAFAVAQGQGSRAQIG